MDPRTLAQEARERADAALEAEGEAVGDFLEELALIVIPALADALEAAEKRERRLEQEVKGLENLRALVDRDTREKDDLRTELTRRIRHNNEDNERWFVANARLREELDESLESEARLTVLANDRLLELTRLREENERLTHLTDYLRNGEVSVDEQEAEYTRLHHIEEAAREAHGILQINLGDVDPHVRSACDLIWTALEEKP